MFREDILGSHWCHGRWYCCRYKKALADIPLFLAPKDRRREKIRTGEEGAQETEGERKKRTPQSRREVTNSKAKARYA